jgi:predicted Zn-dependent peptidase
VDIGSRDEPSGLEGISHFIEHMVFKGTASRSALDIVSYIESVGGILNAFTTRENTCFLSKIIDIHLPRAVEILTDLVFNTLCTPGDVIKEKKIVIDEINEVKDNPADLVHDIFATSIFGSHPLGRSILGTTRSVRSFNRKKILSFLNTNYLRKKMIFVASGNLKHHALVELAKKYVPQPTNDNLPASPAFQRVKRFKPVLQSGIYVTSRDTTQTHICIGTPGLNFNHPNRAALLLLNSILGGSMSSKLFQKIREDLGLAYTVFSYLDFFKDTSVIGVYLNTDKKHAGTVLNVILKELDKLKKEKLSALELASAKEQLKGSLVLGLENTSHRMNRLAKHELLLGKPISINETIREIDRVTPSDIRNLANRLFQREQFVITVLGPVNQKKIENSFDWQ